MQTSMIKQYVLKVLLAGLFAILAVVAVAPVRFPHSDARVWMAALHDNTPLRDLYIPGTHDSGALYSFADAAGKCQTIPVSQQLHMGVRFLDIRLRLVEDSLCVYHSFVEQKLPFDSLLQQMASFLRENPTEFLIVSLKEEAAPIRSASSFADVLEKTLSRYPELLYPKRSLPEKVGSARGKMLILARYKDASIGVACYNGWKDNTAFRLGGIYVQDHYSVRHADEKWADILDGFSAAASKRYGLVLNYSSCYLESGFPPLYAGNTARDINPMLEMHLKNGGGCGCVLVCDFITSELTETIIGRNAI